MKKTNGSNGKEAVQFFQIKKYLHTGEVIEASDFTCSSDKCSGNSIFMYRQDNEVECTFCRHIGRLPANTHVRIK